MKKFWKALSLIFMSEKSSKEISIVKEIIDKLKAEELKKFPNDFLNNVDCIEEIIPNKTLIISSELFGQYEIRTSDGEFFKMVDDIFTAKYYVYYSLLRKTKLKIPSAKSDLEKIVKEYEKYFDTVVRVIDNQLDRYGQTSNKLKLTNEIIQSLNLIRF